MDNLYQVTSELLINIANVRCIKPCEHSADLTTFVFTNGSTLDVRVPYSRIMDDLRFYND